MKTLLTYILILAAAVMLSGCGSRAINKNQYVLDISPPAVKAAQRSDSILEVRSFNIDSQFSGRQMVYRVGEFRYSPDYYNEFLISPATMITQAVRNWVADTGMFARVLEPGSSIRPTYVLNGTIAACYADIREKAAPAAVLKVRMFLTKQDGGPETLVWSRTYDLREPMKDLQAESFAAAMSKCVDNVLQKLQENLQELAI
jgi:cholesterol transport system auxiliary component